MPKRGENIYRRKDGRWEGRILQSCESGKRKYRSVYGKSYHEVKQKMMTARLAVQAGCQKDQTLARPRHGCSHSRFIGKRVPYPHTGKC